ncbi:unnamed protein product [Linum trigynum]|uniref:Uncharacterized protein n=1 Tax=Linum trigynum TaxID=586398 RepID=A0AAV2F538_9ROSI
MSSQTRKNDLVVLIQFWRAVCKILTTQRLRSFFWYMFFAILPVDTTRIFNDIQRSMTTMGRIGWNIKR